jgi:hypothetical protein
MCVVDRKDKSAIEAYIKAHSLYPQSTPQNAETAVNL